MPRASLRLEARPTSQEPGAPRLDLDVEMHAPPAELSGVALYAERLHRHLAPLLDARLVRRWSREWRVGGRVVGGTLTRLASRAASIGRGEVVHAVDPMSAPTFGRLDVLTVHDVLPLQYPELYGAREADVNRRVLRAALRRDPLVVTPTRAARAALLAHVDADPDRVFVSHHGVDERVLAGATNPRPAILRVDKPVVLLNMDDNPRKRADLVLEACLGLDVHVVHVGGRRPSFAAHAERVGRAGDALRAQGRYVRLERVDAALLGALYAHCDLFVHATRDEGFGMPPLEAMACGARVLASDVAVLREVLGEHATYAPLELAAMRDAIEAALLVREETAALSRAAAHARALTWERHALEMASLYMRARHPDNPAAWTL